MKHQVRIIGGHWKRTRLHVADRPGLRPTPDRVRETLFNWLGQDLTGWRCLDAFAGSGALGLEAASRGAGAVLLVEQDGVLVEQLQKMKLQLQAEKVAIRRGDGLMALRQASAASLELVFLDPPYDSSFYEPALAAALPALSARGYVYLEAARAWAAETLAALGLAPYRYLRAGAVHAHLLRAA